MAKDTHHGSVNLSKDRLELDTPVVARRKKYIDFDGDRVGMLRPGEGDEVMEVQTVQRRIDRRAAAEGGDARRLGRLDQRHVAQPLRGIARQCRQDQLEPPRQHRCAARLVKVAGIVQRSRNPARRPVGIALLRQIEREVELCRVQSGLDGFDRQPDKVQRARGIVLQH